MVCVVPIVLMLGCFGAVNAVSLSIPNGTLSMQVLGPRDKPISGALVRVSSWRDNEPFGFGMNGNNSYKESRSKTNRDGKAKLTIYDKRFMIRIQAEGYEDYRERNFLSQVKSPLVVKMKFKD